MEWDYVRVLLQIGIRANFNSQDRVLETNKLQQIFLGFWKIYFKAWKCEKKDRKFGEKEDRKIRCAVVGFSSKLIRIDRLLRV